MTLPAHPDLTATVADDDAAFVQALQSATAAHLALALRMLSDREDAEEAVQEAWFRAWRHRGAMRDGGALHGWMRQIVARECLRLLRRRAVRRWLPFGDAVPDVPSWLPGPEAEVVDRELLVRARRAVDALPPRQRLVWGLRYDEGWSVGEIAAATELSTETVKTHLGRALLAVQAKLEVRRGV